jgi:hypothetical protein
MFLVAHKVTIAGRKELALKTVNNNEYAGNIENSNTALCINYFTGWLSTHFLALQMVSLSSLHDDKGHVDIFRHYRRDALVIALRMVVLLSILDRHHLLLTFLIRPRRELRLLTIFFGHQPKSFLRGRVVIVPTLIPRNTYRTK